MASQTASAHSRVPKQERGRLRVIALLQAAEATIGERGYDAATMTEIAERAGAAIGSLYQFFATKEAIADTLRTQLNDGLCRELAALEDRAAQWSPAEFARNLFEVVLGFLRRHPALTAIAAARGSSPSLAKVRPRLRAAIANAIKANSPAMPAARARLAAVVIWQIMRAATTLASETRLRERRAALREIETVLAAYLDGIMENDGTRDARKPRDRAAPAS